MISPEPRWTMRQLQEHLGVGQTTAYGLVASSQIPHLRIGRSIRLRPEDVLAWEAGQLRHGLADADVVPLRAARGRRGR